MATVVSERKRTEILVCDGCRGPLHEPPDLERLVTVQIGTERVVTLYQFHRVGCLRRWVSRFDVG